MRAAGLNKLTPNDPSYQTAFAAIISESVRISASLERLLLPGEEPNNLADFFTAELATTLRLNRNQRSYVYQLLINKVRTGATVPEHLDALLVSKPELALQIQSILSRFQKQQFLAVHGEDLRNLFTFAMVARLSNPKP
jgi:hypothetical protein